MSKKVDIPFGRPWITNEDRDTVLEVLKRYAIADGPMYVSFEAEFVNMMSGSFEPEQLLALLGSKSRTSNTTRPTTCRLMKSEPMT